MRHMAEPWTSPETGEGGQPFRPFDRQALQATLADALRDAEVADGLAADPDGAGTVPAPSASAGPAMTAPGVPAGPAMAAPPGAGRPPGGAPRAAIPGLPAPGPAEPAPATSGLRPPNPFGRPTPGAPTAGAQAPGGPTPGGPAGLVSGGGFVGGGGVAPRPPQAAPQPMAAPIPGGRVGPSMLPSQYGGISPADAAPGGSGPRPLGAPAGVAGLGGPISGLARPGELGGNRMVSGLSPAAPVAPAPTIPLRRPSRPEAPAPEAKAAPAPPAPAPPQPRPMEPIAAWSPADDDILPGGAAKRRSRRSR